MADPRTLKQVTKARLKKPRKQPKKGIPNIRAFERASTNASFKRGLAGARNITPKPPSDGAPGLKTPTPRSLPTNAALSSLRSQPGEAIAKRTGSPYAERAFAATSRLRRKLPQVPRSLGRAKGMTK